MITKKNKVISNDALVVLAFGDDGIAISHHKVKRRMEDMAGYEITASDCHNMLHRAIGLVNYNQGGWYLAERGKQYRKEVVKAMADAVVKAAEWVQSQPT